MIDENSKTSFPNHGLCLESLCLVEWCCIECMFHRNVAAASCLSDSCVDRCDPGRQDKAWETEQQGQTIVPKVPSQKLIGVPTHT